MDCKTVSELLPWLLNGTITDDEQRRLVEHLERCEACSQEIDETRQAWRMFDPHIPSTSLVNHAMDPNEPLSKEEQIHLEHCATCTEELQLVRSDTGLEAFCSSRSQEPSRQRTFGSQRLVWLATAAAVVIGTGLGALVSHQLHEAGSAGERVQTASLMQEVESLATANQRLSDENRALQQEQATGQEIIARLQQSLSEQTAPQVNVPVLELLPDDFEVRGPADTTVIPGDRPMVTLILASPMTLDYRRFRLEIADQAGEVIWQARDLVRHETNDFTLLLPTSLGQGPVTIRVLGHRDGTWQEVLTYRARIGPRDASSPLRAPASHPRR